MTIQIAQTVIAPIPGHVTGVAAGYIFGTFEGALYSVIGVSIGSYIAVRLSRIFGRGYVESTVSEKLLSKFDAFMTDQGGKALFIVFLLPGLPDDALCFIAGLSDIKMSKLMTIIIIARTPAFFLAAAAGNSLAMSKFMEFGTITFFVAAISIIGFWKIEEIQEFVDSRT